MTTAAQAFDIAFAEETFEWPEWLPQHLSASQLSMLERCPEQFRRRYVLGEKERPSTALIWGAADGRAHGVNFTQKITTGTDLPVTDVEQAFAAQFDMEVDERGGPGEIDWRDDKPGEIKDRGVKLVNAYHTKVSPRIQPTGIEQPIAIAVAGVPVPYIGYVDVDTETYAIERKTSSAKSSSIPPQYQLQTLGYALARQRPVEVHISTRTKLPAVYTPSEEPGLLLPFDERLVTRAERVLASRARLLYMLATEFGQEQPWPDGIGTMSWHMHVCDLCGYRPSCSYWGAA